MTAKDFSAAELEAIRSDFPILSRHGRGGAPIAYLDASATSQKPRQVIEAEADFYRLHNGAVHRDTHLLGDESTDAFERARSVLAGFIGGRADEVVWTKNATEAINLVALAIGHASCGRGGAAAERLRIGQADRIVITRAEHVAGPVGGRARRPGHAVRHHAQHPPGRPHPRLQRDRRRLAGR